MTEDAGTSIFPVTASHDSRGMNASLSGNIRVSDIPASRASEVVAVDNNVLTTVSSAHVRDYSVGAFVRHSTNVTVLGILAGTIRTTRS